MIESERLRSLLEIITSLKLQVFQLEKIIRELRLNNCKEDIKHGN